MQPQLIICILSVDQNIDHQDEMEETEVAVRWRAMTASQLRAMANANDADNNKICEELREHLEHLLTQDLGYPVTRKQLIDNKMDQLLTRALSFAQLLIQQRAIFKLLVPSLEEYGHVKKENDTFRENSGSSNLSELDDEVGGPVWFLVKPGLVKLGTGQGSKLEQKTVLKKALVELAL